MYEIVDKLLELRNTYRNMAVEANKLRGQKFKIDGSLVGEKGVLEVTVNEVDIAENYLGFSYESPDQDEDNEPLWDVVTIFKFVNNIIR